MKHLLTAAALLLACSSSPAPDATPKCTAPDSCGAFRVCIDGECRDLCDVPRPMRFECPEGTWCDYEAEFPYCRAE